MANRPQPVPPTPPVIHWLEIRHYQGSGEWPILEFLRKKCSGQVILHIHNGAIASIETRQGGTPPDPAVHNQ